MSQLVHAAAGGFRVGKYRKAIPIGMASAGPTGVASARSIKVSSIPVDDQLNKSPQPWYHLVGHEMRQKQAQVPLPLTLKGLVCLVP